MYILKRTFDHIELEGSVSRSFNRRGKPTGEGPVKGSRLMVTHNRTWGCTEEITEILEQKDDNYFKFNTINGTIWEWTKLQ